MIHALCKDMEVKQAMRGAISLHHISLIHFLAERLKLPTMRNVGQRGQFIRAESDRETNKADKQWRKWPFSQLPWPVWL